MTRLYVRSSRLVLAVSLTVSVVASLLCGVTRADDVNAGKSIRIPAAAFSPIGSVYSLGEVSINGHSASGEHLIWNGDLLEASDDAVANVTLDSIGRIMLERGSRLRLATLVSRADETNGPVLIISLLSGKTMVHLEEDVSAYVEACESAFTASSGAKFRIEIRANHTVTSVMSGNLTQELITSRTYHVRLIKAVLSARQDMEVKKGQTARNEYQVDKSETKKKKGGSDLRVSLRRGAESTAVQTAIETPAAGKRVQFTLGQNIGELTPSTTTTDSQGRASVSFKARTLGETDLTATVIDLKKTEDEEENSESNTVHIRVVKAGFWTRNKLLIAAAAGGGVVCVFACHPKTKPLQQQPPPIIQ